MFPIDCQAKITKSPDFPTFMIGDEVKLTCTVNNVNKAIKKELNYEWFKSGVGSDDAEVKLGKTGNHIIIKLSSSSAGKYQCSVTSDKLEIKSNPLSLEVGELSANVATCRELPFQGLVTNHEYRIKIIIV